MNKWILILLAGFTIGTSSCRKTAVLPVDGVMSATALHGETAVCPPSNSFYQVLGHYEGLKNYVVKYDDHFYRGGEIYLDDSARNALGEFGIKTVVSVTPSDQERAFCATNGLELIEVPFEKNGPTEEDYRGFFQALEKAPVPYYVHCKGGSHRAGILGAAYRIRMQNWSFDKAVVEYGRLGGDLKADNTMIESLQRIKP